MADHHLLRTDLGEKRSDAKGKPLLDERVEDPVGNAALGHESCRLEHAEVTRDRRGADREPTYDLTGREFASLQILQDLTAGRIRECLEHASNIIHIPMLAH